MILSYADFAQNQEEPEEFPNELTFHLSRSTGHDHFRIHRALLALNPTLNIVGGTPHLTPADTAAVLSHAEDDLLAGAGVSPRHESQAPYQLAA